MKIRKEIEIIVNELTVKPGQTFTVWLDREPEIGRRDAIQVELRVTPECIPEIFCNTNLVIKPFSEWVGI